MGSKATAKEIKSSRKPANEFYTKLVSQKVSHYFSALFINLGISANTVTFFMVFFGLPTIALLLSDNIVLEVIGAFGLIFINIFDTCDGEVARFNKKTTQLGVYLDNIYQFIVDIALLYVLAYKFYFIKDSKLLATIIFFYAIVFIFDNYAKKVAKSTSKDVAKSGNIKKSSTLQFLIHITSTNTFVCHSLWIVFILDYYFGDIFNSFLIYFSYLFATQMLKTLGRQYIYFKQFSTNENL